MDTTTAPDPIVPDSGPATCEQRREATIALLDAASRDDWDAVLAGYSPDVVWINPPTAGPWAGRFEGIDAVASMFAEYLAFFDGTFTQEIVDVCASPDRSVVLLVERGAKFGHTYENRALWTSRFDESGRIIEVVAVDRDLHAAESFWNAVTG